MFTVNRLIFLTDSLFSLRDYRRYGIELLEKNGFQVEVWDFTPFLEPKVHSNFKVPDPIDFQGFKTFVNKKEACRAIGELDDSCFILCFLGYRVNTFSIYWAISKRNIRYCVNMALPVPVPGIKLFDIDKGFYLNINEFKIILQRIKGIAFEKIVNKLLHKIPCKYFGINPATLILLGGEKSMSFYNSTCGCLVGPKTEKLWLHSFDYDNYLREKEDTTVVNGAVGVFLDQNQAFHPDYYTKQSDPPLVTVEEYFPVINKFFDALEKEYKVKIVIAAHPSSNYQNHPEYFANRQVYQGKTSEEVRKSAFVIADSSISINYAVMYRKPVIFITTDQMSRDKIMVAYQAVLASIFKKHIYNLNNSVEINWQEEMKVNEDIYNDYQNMYIKKSGTKKALFWQLFSDYIKSNQ